MTKRALITGITGQDGAYLAQFLLTQGYEVYGGYRRTSTIDRSRLEELGIAEKIKFVSLDLLEYNNVMRALREVRPQEVYNLAAQSFVGVSFDQPIFTAEVNAVGVMRLLEAVREVVPDARFYQASTSEMFGLAAETPQSETTPFHPRSPYACSKVFAHWATVNYREAYDMHASCGILFNHESPLRGKEFVTRRITSSLASIRAGRPGELVLGNLYARRDWGYAPDYVRGMWLMLQQSRGDDFVLATGASHSVEEFVEVAAEAAGLRLVWEGEGIERRARDQRTGRVIVRVDPRQFRPAEVATLQGDFSKARQRLGWTPQVDFYRLVEIMVEADLRRVGAL